MLAADRLTNELSATYEKHFRVTNWVLSRRYGTNNPKKKKGKVVITAVNSNVSFPVNRQKHSLNNQMC